MKKGFSLPWPLAVLALVLLVAGAVYTAILISENSTAQHFVAQFGYLGIVGLSLIAGLNLFVPVPVGVFVPIFIASGLSGFGILTSMVIGTVIADVVGFFIGMAGKEYVDPSRNRWYQRMVDLKERRSKWIPPFVTLYAAFAPYPNELIVIPLAFLGVRLRVLIIPLIIGTVVYQSLFFFGISTILRFFGIE